ncbi:bifunctional 2-polyprenyl-6-hydroxyphenol methylase/3-demethylubiquinol 3-O-methyltransferase UbiG [Mycobacterium sp. TY815]|uniref:class I SAM-dependent methyltransferase n=1 Tax=Mycobacterium sp. TY815 TaxID=3050581 RepID=UPI0027425C06|nr:class I SAM-dependent methyltransferase [Mycobacterium sp. TY815]MDP7702031.1 class I SAM-dependent methyltransferase [Mycobacterium sp. TY815]
MSEHDRRRWDERYAGFEPVQVPAVGPPSFLEPYADLIPTRGHALDIACGRGLGSVWLASRGLTVWGVDISGVAITQARDLATSLGFAERCRFDVVDLDDGLPAGPTVDVLLCNKFRDRRLDRAMIARLAPGGLLALCTLSEVGAEPGRFRATRGELPSAFGELTLLAAGEAAGYAWLVGRA